MNQKTRTLALTAILAAITLVLGLTPLGIISIPGLIEITLMCIPVIAGALVLGWKPGVALGLIFALTSIVAAFTRSPLGAVLLEESVPKTLLLLILPRVLVPVAAAAAYRSIHARKQAVNAAVASALGSLANTALFLAMLSGMFANIVAAEVFTFAALVNGTIEAVVAVVVCTPVVSALKKSVPPMAMKREKAVK